MKMNSSSNHDGFYDGHSSSSDDEYFYSRRDFESDSSDSDYDLPKNPNARVVFVNGRQIKPTTNCIAAKKIQNGGDSNLCGPSPSRRIRFADDGEDRMCSRITAKSNAANDMKSKATMTVRIRSGESKSSTCLKASGDKAATFDKHERCVIEDEQRPITKIRIQSIERSSTDKSSKAKVTASGHVAERQFRQLQREDSGILQSSSSSVSQDTADSFDKEEASRIETRDSVDKENNNTTLAKADCKDKGRIDRQREVTIECARSQLDSGFEDPERVSPGGFSSKENSLKRGITRPPGDSFDDYPNVLRQASLRVFGLVGRRVKAFNKAALQADDSEVVKNGHSVNKERACNKKIVDNEERKIFMGRLEEFYKAKLPLLADVTVQGSIDAVMQNAQNVKEEIEEEEWPEPPTFDEDLMEENEMEVKNVSECFEVKVDNQQGIVEARKIVKENLPQDKEEKDACRSNRPDFEPFDYEENYRCGSKMKKFQEPGTGNEETFKEFKEGAGNSTDVLAHIQHRGIDMYDQRNYYQSNTTGHEKQREREFEMGSEYIRGYKERTFDDDCTVCELLSSEKRALRRSADMESFRKTTLNDCDSVMKKMRHAQQIARKISGNENPRRASMHKSRKEGIASAAEGQITQLKSNNSVENRRFEDENDESTRVVNAVGVDSSLLAYAVSDWNSPDGRNRCGINANPFGTQHGSRTQDRSFDNVTAATDFHPAARQHFEEQFDAKSFFVQQFNREKNRQKVKRNLSEDFLIVNAMPCAQRKEPGKYDKSFHHVNKSQSITPRYDAVHGRSLEPRHDAQHDELRCNAKAIYPRFNSEPSFNIPHDHLPYKSQEQWYGAIPDNGEILDNSSEQTYRWRQEKVKSPNINPYESAPSRQTPVNHPNSNFVPLAPKGNHQNGPFTWALHPQSSPSDYQQESNKMASNDPFRAEREKSWFKKAARRLRRSLSFEDNSRKGADKGHASGQMPIRPCSSSGNIKDEYESYVTRETRGFLYSDEGPRMQVSKAAKRSSVLHGTGREHSYTNDPNFHPKYGFMPNNKCFVGKSYSNMRPTSPTYLEANGGSLNDVSKFVVQHNMYFGNNPSTPNARSLGPNGVSSSQAYNGREEVIQPLQVRKSSQKTARDKSLLSRK